VEISEQIKCRGDIECIIEYDDGTPTETWEIRNTILKNGRIALAKVLANELDGFFNFYISRMVFGSSGTNGSVPKYVDDGRNGLFGLTVLTKPVISTVDPNLPTQVILTSVIPFDEANGIVLNEMALQMNNGQLYSMRTFPDLTKTTHMQVTWNWRLNFI
jgi:hypothetical protein